jgi:hypothetical protein
MRGVQNVVQEMRGVQNVVQEQQQSTANLFSKRDNVTDESAHAVLLLEVVHEAEGRHHPIVLETTSAIAHALTNDGGGDWRRGDQECKKGYLVASFVAQRKQMAAELLELAQEIR